MFYAEVQWIDQSSADIIKCNTDFFPATSFHRFQSKRPSSRAKFRAMIDFGSERNCMSCIYGYENIIFIEKHLGFDEIIVHFNW